MLPERISGYEVREQQITMALLVEQALREERHTLVEAGTGTGKSFAYLVPLALGLDGARAVVSTATIALQEQLVHKDIPFLEQALGTDLRAMLAKGKGNYLCLLRLRDEMESPSLFEADLFDRLLAWAKQTTTGDRAELNFNLEELWSRVSPDDGCPGRKCFFYRDCFFVRARASLQDAGLIVCNHALFFNDLNVPRRQRRTGLPAAGLPGGGVGRGAPCRGDCSQEHEHHGLQHAPAGAAVPGAAAGRL